MSPFARPLRRPAVALTRVAFLSVVATTGGHAAPLSVAEFGQLSLRCGPSVAPLTLASIARTESRFQPLTISDNTVAETAVPATLPIAAEIATRLIAVGHSVDLGIMQINSANLARLGLTPALALDPCHSIAAAAVLLTDDYSGGDTHEAQQSALRDALSRYNTGDAVRGYGNGYVHKVELSAREVVPALDVSGTPAAAVPGNVDRKVSVAPATIAAVTPTSWNVWAEAGHETGSRPPEIFVGDEDGVAVSVATSSPSTER